MRGVGGLRRRGARDVLVAVTLALVLAAACCACEREAESGDILHVLDDEGRPIELRVDAVLPDPRDADDEVRLYEVSARDANGAWAPYCMPDVEGRRAAIPVAGAWDAQVGRLRVNADTFTFACTSGAIGKCVRFGYKPWRGARSSALHAACTRMVRADYCGDGRPHTVDGTIIDIFDIDGIQREERDPHKVETFEAAWGPDGATYLNIPRLSDDVRAIVAECPAHFAGRTSLDISLDAAGARARFPEALLFNNRTRPRE
jgi:hypothetical protein